MRIFFTPRSARKRQRPTDGKSRKGPIVTWKNDIFMSTKVSTKKKCTEPYTRGRKENISQKKTPKKVIIIRNLETKEKIGGGGGERTHKISNEKSFDYFSFSERTK